MFKAVAFLYIIVFGCYVLFTREPDFFESETTDAYIIKQKDTLRAQYIVNDSTYKIPLDYVFLNVKESETATVVYNKANPQSARIYSVFGYWIRWKELLFSIIGFVVLYGFAAAITNNPTKEALAEEAEMRKKQPKKPRYDV